jgi:SPP1 gp7 family putative phage head morphogenesis protein
MAGRPNGAIEPLVGDGATTLAALYDRWTDEVLKSLEHAGEGAHGIHTRVFVALHAIEATSMAREIWRIRMRAAMTGSLDVLWETTHDKDLPLQFQTKITVADVALQPAPSGGIAGFTQLPFPDAIEAFKAKESITKSQWLTLNIEEQRRAFTVAGLAKDEYVSVVKDELEKTLQSGLSAKAFGEALAARMEAAGLSALNPSHAELVFRQNVATAYSEGRLKQMQSPMTLKTHGFWQLRGVDDRTTRPTHRAAHGIVLPADDPFFARAGIGPFGFRCRCSSIARRTGSGKTSADYPELAELPDEGYTR